LCLAIGVYPKPLIDTIKPDVDAVANVYDQLKVPMRGRSWEQRPAVAETSVPGGAIAQSPIEVQP